MPNRLRTLCALCSCELLCFMFYSCASGYFYRAPNPTASGVAIMNVNSFDDAQTLGNDRAEISAMLSTPIEVVGRVSRLNDDANPPLQTISTRGNGFVVPSLTMKYGVSSSVDVGMNMTTIFFISGLSTKFYAKWNVIDTTSAFALALMPSLGYSSNAVSVQDATGEVSGGLAFGEIAAPMSYTASSGNFSIHLTPRLLYLNYALGYAIESTIYSMSGSSLLMPRTITYRGTLQNSTFVPGASLGMKFFHVVSAELSVMQCNGILTPLFGLSFHAPFSTMFSSPYFSR